MLEIEKVSLCLVICLFMVAESDAASGWKKGGKGGTKVIVISTGWGGGGHGGGHGGGY